MEPSQCIRIGSACIKKWSRKPTQCVNICNACIKIWSRKRSRCIKTGEACIKIWNRVFSALCDNFRHCATIFGTVRFFSKKVSKILGCPPPARINITPAACRTPTAPFPLGSLIINTPAGNVLQCEKIGYSSVRY